MARVSRLSMDGAMQNGCLGGGGSRTGAARPGHPDALEGPSSDADGEGDPNGRRLRGVLVKRPRRRRGPTRVKDARSAAADREAALGAPACRCARRRCEHVGDRRHLRDLGRPSAFWRRPRDSSSKEKSKEDASTCPTGSGRPGPRCRGVKSDSEQIEAGLLFLVLELDPEHLTARRLSGRRSG